jgi:hypothetical protein
VNAADALGVKRLHRAARMSHGFPGVKPAALQVTQDYLEVEAAMGRQRRYGYDGLDEARRPDTPQDWPQLAFPVVGAIQGFSSPVPKKPSNSKLARQAWLEEAKPDCSPAAWVIRVIALAKTLGSPLVDFSCGEQRLYPSAEHDAVR